MAGSHQANSSRETSSERVGELPLVRGVIGKGDAVEHVPGAHARRLRPLLAARTPKR